MSSAAIRFSPETDRRHSFDDSKILEMFPNGSALVLEDNDLDAAIIKELLEKRGPNRISVRRACMLTEAVTLLKRQNFDVVILDLNVPDSRGLSTIREAVRANSTVPIVVASEIDDIDTAIEALEMGAQEYLAKPQFDNVSLHRAIQFSIQRKRQELKLTSRAYYDSLTNLSNRSHLYERWQRCLIRGMRSSGRIGVLVADIDAFKSVNDRFGHAAGDQLLTEFARLLRNNVRESDILARLGGDEFVLVLENLTDDTEISNLISRLTDQGPHFFEFDGAKIPFSVSVGSTFSDPADREDLMAVLRRADEAMYLMKGRQNNCQ